MTICPKCKSEENFHYNYDYTKKDLPIIDVLCNECGEIFEYIEVEDEEDEENNKNQENESKNI